MLWAVSHHQSTLLPFSDTRHHQSALLPFSDTRFLLRSPTARLPCSQAQMSDSVLADETETHVAGGASALWLAQGTTPSFWLPPTGTDTSNTQFLNIQAKTTRRLQSDRMEGAWVPSDHRRQRPLTSCPPESLTSEALGWKPVSQWMGRQPQRSDGALLGSESSKRRTHTRMSLNASASRYRGTIQLMPQSLPLRECQLI